MVRNLRIVSVYCEINAASLLEKEHLEPLNSIGQLQEFEDMLYLP